MPNGTTRTKRYRQLGLFSPYYCRLKGGINLAASWLQRGRRKKKEKKKGRSRAALLDDPDPSPPSFVGRQRCTSSSSHRLKQGEEVISSWSSPHMRQ
ncbi:hypothetical protein B296_00050410 [Ensete ventricosum]|uniref:Uncharacterized protein n=1 Tax=Ensete ventricosum TaxID=4639 RepID=A0A426YLA8_ENSVE|nr:hypothetical protein B296_00050410 [Ensete ventricosum]